MPVRQRQFTSGPSCQGRKSDSWGVFKEAGPEARGVWWGGWGFTTCNSIHWKAPMSFFASGHPVGVNQVCLVEVSSSYAGEYCCLNRVHQSLALLPESLWLSIHPQFDNWKKPAKQHHAHRCMYMYLYEYIKTPFGLEIFFFYTNEVFP